MNIDNTNSHNRRIRNTLYICGIAAIAFSVWGVVRNTAYLFLTHFMSSELEKYSFPLEFVTVIYVAILLCILIDALLHIYVGISAINESKGKKKSCIYLVLTVIMILFSAFSIVTYFFIDNSSMSKVDFCITTAVELTCMLNMCELIKSAISVRRHRRKQLKQNEPECSDLPSAL